METARQLFTWRNARHLLYWYVAISILVFVGGGSLFGWTV
jgi:hypothetical protein